MSEGVVVPSFEKKEKKTSDATHGLLQKAELATEKTKDAVIEQTKQRAEDLTVETRKESGEERAEVPDWDIAAIKAAIEAKLQHREGSSAISLETGKVIPGTDTQAKHHGTPLERVPSGIPGLDDEIEGGFVKHSINLVTGSPGAGKTIFATQFIINGIEHHNEPGLYISFEEKEENFFKYMLQFGWDLEKHKKAGKFTFLRYSPEQVHKLLTEGGGLVDSIVRKQGVKRLCLDSISAFALLFKDELSAREALLGLFELMEGWGTTTILTAEQESEPEKHTPSVVEFEVDSVISLYNFRRKNIRQRVAEIIKMRGTQFAQKVFPIKIGDEGMIFYPEEAAF